MPPIQDATAFKVSWIDCVLVIGMIAYNSKRKEAL